MKRDIKPVAREAGDQTRAGLSVNDKLLIGRREATAALSINEPALGRMKH